MVLTALAVDVEPDVVGRAAGDPAPAGVGVDSGRCDEDESDLDPVLLQQRGHDAAEVLEA